MQKKENAKLRTSENINKKKKKKECKNIISIADSLKSLQQLK